MCTDWIGWGYNFEEGGGRGWRKLERHMLFILIATNSYVIEGEDDKVTYLTHIIRTRTIFGYGERMNNSARLKYANGVIHDQINGPQLLFSKPQSRPHINESALEILPRSLISDSHQVLRNSYTPTPRRGPRGGGQGCLAPPPIFWGKNKGAKNHTHRKKWSKSDNHEARYRLKRTPKHTKYAQIFKSTLFSHIFKNVPFKMYT